MTEIPVLLLAAGSSSRLGQPKQLLPWGKVTLIEHQIITLLNTGNPVNVVLGCHSDLIIPVLKNYKINIIINDRWEEGMGSSISSGIAQIERSFPDVSAVIISLIDQPFVSASHIKIITGNYIPDCNQIIVSQSDSGWIGVPALFDKTYFKHLIKLEKDEGAKKIIKRFEENVTILNCKDLLEDIDTTEAYNKLLKQFK